MAANTLRQAAPQLRTPKYLNSCRKTERNIGEFSEFFRVDFFFALRATLEYFIVKAKLWPASLSYVRENTTNRSWKQGIQQCRHPTIDIARATSSVARNATRDSFTERFCSNRPALQCAWPCRCRKILYLNLKFLRKKNKFFFFGSSMCWCKTFSVHPHRKVKPLSALVARRGRYWYKTEMFSLFYHFMMELIKSVVEWKIDDCFDGEPRGRKCWRRQRYGMFLCGHNTVYSPDYIVASHPLGKLILPLLDRAKNLLPKKYWEENLFSCR